MRLRHGSAVGTGFDWTNPSNAFNVAPIMHRVSRLTWRWLEILSLTLLLHAAVLSRGAAEKVLAIEGTHFDLQAVAKGANERPLYERLNPPQNTLDRRTLGLFVALHDPHTGVRKPRGHFA